MGFPASKANAGTPPDVGLGLAEPESAPHNGLAIGIRDGVTLGSRVGVWNPPSLLRVLNESSSASSPVGAFDIEDS